MNDKCNYTTWSTDVYVQLILECNTEYSFDDFTSKYAEVRKQIKIKKFSSSLELEAIEIFVDNFYITSVAVSKYRDTVLEIPIVLNKYSKIKFVGNVQKLVVSYYVRVELIWYTQN